MNKKVIFVIESLSFGGAERRLVATANELSKIGVSVTIIITGKNEVRYNINGSIHLVVFNKKKLNDYIHENYEVLPYDFSTCTNTVFDKVRDKMVQLLYEKNQYDKYEYSNELVYLKKNYSFTLKKYLSQHKDATIFSFTTIINIGVLVAVEHMPNRVVISENTSPQFEFSEKSIFNKMKRNYYPRANAMIFQTDEAMSYYEYIKGIEKVVIPNPITEKFPERYEGIRKKVVVSFCRLHEVKNIPLLIDSFEILHREYPDYKLEIYGNGKIKGELEEYIQLKGLANCAVIRDARSDIHEYIRNCAMFVSSSNREGISNSMLEALAIGLPCVCTDCPAGGARMVIQDGVNGLLVPVGDKNAMYEAMKKIVSDCQLSERLSKEAIKVNCNYSMSNIIKKWYELI